MRVLTPGRLGAAVRLLLLILSLRFIHLLFYSLPFRWTGGFQGMMVGAGAGALIFLAVREWVWGLYLLWLHGLGRRESLLHFIDCM